MKALLGCRGFDVTKEHGLGFGAVFRDAAPEVFGFERREKALYRGVVIIAGIAAMLGEMKLFQLTKAWLSVGIMTRPAAAPMSEIQELRQQVAALKAEVVERWLNEPIQSKPWPY